MLLPHITVGIKIMISKEIASVEPVNEKNTPNKAVHNIADNKPKNSKNGQFGYNAFCPVWKC